MRGREGGGGWGVGGKVRRTRKRETANKTNVHQVHVLVTRGKEAVMARARHTPDKNIIGRENRGGRVRD